MLPFHLGQNILRKVKELNLYSEYMFDTNIKKFIKTLVALSYVKKELIIKIFNEIKTEHIFPTTLHPLYIYLFTNYILIIKLILKFLNLALSFRNLIVQIMN